MKNSILLLCLLLVSCLAYGQDKGFRILPEGGLSIPTADFKAKNVFADQGFLGGINFDVHWGKFGVELYGGINKNGIDYQDGLPPVGGLIVSKPNSITRDSWKQLLIGLGPMYQIGLTGKLDLEFSFKVGFSKFTHPEYTESIETGAPLNQRYLMYETMNQDVKKGFDFAAIPGMRLSFKPSEKVAISLGANYTSAMGVEHSYTFLDGDFNPEMSDEQLEAELRAAPTVYELRNCTFNTIGITLGLGYTIGGKDKPKDDPKDDQAMEPPIPQYPPDGSTITPQEADSLVLEWVKETPNVEGANYNFWLYEVRDSTRKHDSLIYKTKVEKNLKLLLPEHIKLKPDSTYRYEVQAVDDKRLKPCPGDCFSRKSIFKVESILHPLYYQLLTQNSGNYVTIQNQLRFQIPKHLSTGGKITARIIKEPNEEVVRIENLLPGQKGDNYISGPGGQVTINIARFVEGYYYLELMNERFKHYFIRFLKTKTNEPDKE